MCELAVRKRTGGLSALESPVKDDHGGRKQYDREEQQELDGRKQMRQTYAAKKRRAHGIQRVSHGIQLCHDLQPIGKYGHRKKHSASYAPQTNEQPFGGIAALEQQ